VTYAPSADGWRRSFTRQSQTEFAEQFADEIVLEATTLAKPAEGKDSAAAAIHHRPLGPVLRFSAEIRDRLAGVIPADHFLREAT
jgi:hypothetical protein